MAIDNLYNFINYQELIEWGRIDHLALNKEPFTTQTINTAIQVSSILVDKYTGFEASRKWPSENTDWTNLIKNAVGELTLYYLHKGTNWLQGSQSLSQGSINFSVSAPNDPYYIPPNVVTILRKVKEYISTQPVNFNNFDTMNGIVVDNDDFLNGTEGQYRPTILDTDRLYIRKLDGLVSTDESISITKVETPEMSFQRQNDIKVDLKANLTEIINIIQNNPDFIDSVKDNILKDNMYLKHKVANISDWMSLHDYIIKLVTDSDTEFITDIKIVLTDFLTGWNGINFNLRTYSLADDRFNFDSENCYLITTSEMIKQNLTITIDKSNYFMAWEDTKMTSGEWEHGYLNILDDTEYVLNAELSFVAKKDYDINDFG